MSERHELPPGPRAPRVLQTLGWWTRPIAYLETLRARYGKTFTVRLLGQAPSVMLSEPAHLRQLFTAPADVLHPGEGARLLGPVVGEHSLILLDEQAHLTQRKLILPAFHGERMKRLEGLVEEVAQHEIAQWPKDEPTPLHPRFQMLTLEIILRAVFGLDPGPRLDALRTSLNSLGELGSRAFTLLPILHHELGGRSPWAKFVELRAHTDALIYELIDERRDDPTAEQRDDVLAMLLAARHEDGSPMSAQELRDELITLLVAGHETTASTLAWAFTRLQREPRVLATLQAELASSDTSDDAYLTATIQETLRRRPVLPNAAPRLVKQPLEIGGRTYPPGVAVVANAYLIHHDPDVYPDPYAFRPERFLDDPPGTYTWIPFGGGRRRCIGASFAMLEMRIVLRAVLGGNDLRIQNGDGRYEISRRRSITISPREGALSVLSERETAPAA